MSHAEHSMEALAISFLMMPISAISSIEFWARLSFDITSPRLAPSDCRDEILPHELVSDEIRVRQRDAELWRRCADVAAARRDDFIYFPPSHL